MPSTVRVAPDEKRPTHHVSLIGPTKTLGLILVDAEGNANPKAMGQGYSPRTALKISQGESGYSDFELPWTPITQQSWVGGQGQLKFEADNTRYLDSFNVNTMFSGKVFPGPLPHYARGIQKADFDLPGDVRFVALIPGSKAYMARSFTATIAQDADRMQHIIRKIGTPGTLTVRLHSDSSGPSTVLKTVTLTAAQFESLVSRLMTFDWSGTQTISLGVKYWMTFYGATTDDDENHWEIGGGGSGANGKESSNGSTWNNTDIDIYYRICETDYDGFFWLFKYKRAVYAVSRPNTTVAPKYYINGDRGAADSNSGQLTKLIDATKSWVNDQWIGAVVRIIGGAGSSEDVPFRTITDNDGTSLTVTPDWKLTHDTTTEYLIESTDYFTEITGHGMTAPVTSKPKTHLGVCYFCQGDGVNVRRMREYNNAGTWTREWADDGTNKKTFMFINYDATNGARWWGINNSDGNGDVSASDAAPVAWGSNLTWATAIVIDDRTFKATGGFGYSQTPYILKEDRPWYISSGKAFPMPLGELETVANLKNGRAVLQHDVYLYISLMNGLERYLDGKLDDMGPNRDEGLLPTELGVSRLGAFSELIGYPGRILGLYDAGADGFSSVQGYNQDGWCELYRAPEPYKSIKSGTFQPIDGPKLDRLWINQGGDILWLGFPSETIEPDKDPAYEAMWECGIQTSYMHATLYDVWKLYNTLKLYTDGLDEGEVRCEFKVDQESAWTSLSDVFTDEPVQEIAILENALAQGKRISFRLRLLTEDRFIVPKIETMVVEGVARVPVKASFAMTFRIQGQNRDLYDQPSVDFPTPESVIDFLNDCAQNLTPLTMHSVSYAYDDHLVFVDPAPLRGNYETMDDRELYIGQLSVIVIR